jgi:hypothetical protein
MIEHIRRPDDVKKMQQIVTLIVYLFMRQANIHPYPQLFQVTGCLQYLKGISTPHSI